MDALMVIKEPRDDDASVELLREWFRWWEETDDAPAKMPDALHLRTMGHLMKRAIDQDPHAFDDGEGI